MSDLTVVIPTFNERDVIHGVIRALDQVLTDIDWDVIFVDDNSPDGTAQILREIAQQRSDVRIIQRVGERGLSSACISGMLASSAPYLAVMDADLQHEETLLPKMLDRLRNSNLDIIIGTRYAKGGEVGLGLSPLRHRISLFATQLSQLVLKGKFSDPMSGFFMLRRPFLERTLDQVSGRGFKILFDLLASSPEPIKFEEIPYEMKPRLAGESKLDLLAIWDFLILILDKIIGRFLPIRFVMFAIVGTLGAILHLFVLYIILLRLNIDFMIAQATATFIAMILNYSLNNILTYRDLRLRGVGFVKGFVTFCIACSIGAVVNVLLADFLYERFVPWWLAGILGAGVGAVWNYGVTSVFTWRVGHTRGPTF